MSKMSDMAMTIEELRNAAAAINEAANWLAAQFSSDADATPVAEAKTEKKPELTLEEVRAVLAEKSRAGHTATILLCFRNMELRSYPVQTLNTMKPC